MSRDNLLGHEIDMVVGGKAIARAVVIDEKFHGQKKEETHEVLLNVVSLEGGDGEVGKPWWFPIKMVHERRKPIYECPNGAYWKIKVEDL